MPPGINIRRAQDRDEMRRQFDRLRRELYQWTDSQGRPHPIVSDGGRPIVELG